MDQNGSITTERPLKPHKNQIQLRSFFLLYSLGSTPHPPVAPGRNSKMIRECFQSSPLLLHSPSFSIPFLFLPVLRCRISIGQRHIVAAVTWQLYTLVYVLFFSLTVSLATLSLFFLCVPCKIPVHSFPAPTRLLQPLSHSLKPRTSSVGTMCVFTVGNVSSS